MTRQRSDRGSDKPEPLGRAISPASVAKPENYRPSLKPGVPYPPDAYPFEPDRADRRAMRIEADFRTRELADLPDSWTEEELVEAEAYWKQWNDERSRS